MTREAGSPLVCGPGSTRNVNSEDYMPGAYSAPVLEQRKGSEGTALSPCSAGQRALAAMPKSEAVVFRKKSGYKRVAS